MSTNALVGRGSIGKFMTLNQEDIENILHLAH